MKLVQWQRQPPLVHRQLQWGFIQKEWTNSGQPVSRSHDEAGRAKISGESQKDVENRDSAMKGCQTTDEQSFAVNEPVSFWQITVNGGWIVHYPKINKLHTLFHSLKLRFTANCSQVTEVRKTAAKNHEAALHCCRSYSEVTIPCTELLNNSLGARERVRIPPCPSVVERDMDFKV